MKEMTLTLNVEEANLVLAALGEQPFAKVFTLIGKIQEQASQQLNGSSPHPPNLSEVDSVPSIVE